MLLKEETMFCTKCGINLNDSQRFCPMCGTPNTPPVMQAQSAAPQAEAVPATPAMPVNEPSPIVAPVYSAKPDTSTVVPSAKPNTKKPVNPALKVTGILSTIDFAFLLVLFALMSVIYIPFLVKSTNQGLGPIIFTLVIIPHIGSVLLYLVSTALMAVGGFAKKNILCFLGGAIFTLDFFVSRLTHVYSDMLLKVDFMKFSRTVPEAIKQLTSHIGFYSYNMSTNLGAVIPITLAMIAVLVILLLRVTGATGTGKKVAAIIIGSIAVFVLLCGCTYDILHQTRFNNPMGMMQKVPYTRYLLSLIRQLPMNLRVGSPARLTMYTHLMHMIKDVYIVILFGVTALTSAITIPSKND